MFGLASKFDPRSRAAALLERPLWQQTLVWLAVIVAVKFNTILEPPVWDSVMGVFPPAVELYRSGWDLEALRQQGGWRIGGPDVHSTSIFTWFLAAVMVLTDSAQATFAIAHLTTFALVALALAVFVKELALLGVRPLAALGSGALLLCLPLFAVQVGYLYTESWVMVFSVLAWSQWRAGHMVRAVLAAFIAVGVKLTGAAIVGCIAVALYIRYLATARSYRAVTTFCVLPAALLILAHYRGWIWRFWPGALGWGDSDALWRAVFARLAAVPDVTFILVLGTLCGVILFGVTLASEQRRRGSLSRAVLGADAVTIAQAICFLMPLAFVALIVASVYGHMLFLSRYILPALPFAVAAIVLSLHRMGLQRLLGLVLAVGCIQGIANWHGRFYAPEYHSFSIVERSHAYQDFLAVQAAMIDDLARMPRDLPVFVTRGIGYMISDPMMGYIDEPPERVEKLYLLPWLATPIDDFPPEFLLAYGNHSHGGEIVRRLLRDAEARPDIHVEQLVHERGGFRAALIHMRRGPSDQPPPAADPQTD